MLLVEFAGFFAFILVFGYLLPAGQFYLWFYVFRSARKEHDRIQERHPGPGQIRREVLLSLSTVAVFAAIATGVFQLYKAGHTAFTGIFATGRCGICQSASRFVSFYTIAISIGHTG
jgi:hypothetical protein